MTDKRNCFTKYGLLVIFNNRVEMEAFYDKSNGPFFWISKKRFIQ